MNIAVINIVDPCTTGNYFRQSFTKLNSVQYLSNNDNFIAKASKGLSISSILQKDRIDLLLYIDPIVNYFPLGLEDLNYPTAIYLIDVHQNLEQRLQLAYFFDYVFVAQKDYLPAFREKGITNVYWLPLACEPETHGYSSTNTDKLYEIGFVGNKGLVGSDRRQLLEKLEANFQLNDLNRKYLPEEIGDIYSKSQIVFNYCINGDVNMRVFEALCSGRLLLTNAIPNGLEELFTDRKHLVIYHNPEEAIELARYYLNNHDEREAIAKAGQTEVLAKHTYDFRTEQILTTIFGSGEPQLVAPIRSWSAKKCWQAYAKVLSNLRQPQAVLQITHQAWKQGEASWDLAGSGVKAALRAVNQRLPITPNAMRHRWRVWQSNFSS
jgi:hypothetical protein